MRTQRKMGFIVLVLFLGAAIGSLLGKFIGYLLPEGVAKDFFYLGIKQSFGPAQLDLQLFALTLGLSIDFNIVGLIGILIAIYLLRWVLH